MLELNSIKCKQEVWSMLLEKFALTRPHNRLFHVVISANVTDGYVLR